MRALNIELHAFCITPLEILLLPGMFDTRLALLKEFATKPATINYIIVDTALTLAYGIISAAEQVSSVEFL